VYGTVGLLVTRKGAWGHYRGVSLTMLGHRGQNVFDYCSRLLWFIALHFATLDTSINSVDTDYLGGFLGVRKLEYD